MVPLVSAFIQNSSCIGSSNCFTHLIICTLWVSVSPEGLCCWKTCYSVQQQPPYADELHASLNVGVSLSPRAYPNLVIPAGVTTLAFKLESHGPLLRFHVSYFNPFWGHPTGPPTSVQRQSREQWGKGSHLYLSTSSYEFSFFFSQSYFLSVPFPLEEEIQVSHAVWERESQMRSYVNPNPKKSALDTYMYEES